jgi:hypothetical protein
MKYPKQEEIEGHPSQDMTTRYADDALFRECGYRIHSRPENGEAIWTRDGRMFSESELIEASKRKNH